MKTDETVPPIDPYAALPVPDPGFRWAAHTDIPAVAMLPISALALRDDWTPVGPVNPADAPAGTPDAGANTDHHEE